MKKVIAVLSCVLLCFIATSVGAQQLKQSVMAAGGGIAIANSLSLEWTLGEPVVEVSPSSLYTQGFHQPVFDARIVKPLTPSIYQVSVSPNPVVSLLKVRVGAVTEAFRIRLTNVVGTVVYLGNQTKLPLTVINISSFKNGIYFLSIIDDSGNQLKSFKIIKL